MNKVNLALFAALLVSSTSALADRTGSDVARSNLGNENGNEKGNGQGVMPKEIVRGENGYGYVVTYNGQKVDATNLDEAKATLKQMRDSDPHEQ